MSRPGVHTGHSGDYRVCAEPACKTHRDRYRKRWTYERSHGQLRLINSTDVRRHIDGLVGAGWSLRAIAGASHASPTTISRIASGSNLKVQRDVAGRILAVAGLPHRPSTQTVEPFISRVGTNRRIQALLFMGWTHRDMLAHSGVRTAVTLNQQGRWVLRSKHDAVEAMYNDLAMRLGPSERTRQRARKLGYVGPLDWDDIDTDEAPHMWLRSEIAPRYDMDPVVIERILLGDFSLSANPAERAEVIRRWPGSDGQLVRATGWNVDRDRRRWAQREGGAA